MSRVLELGVRAKLANDATVAGIVGNRIAVLHIGTDADLPHIVLRTISEDQPRNMQGPSGWKRTRVQVDCTASVYTQLASLSDAVRAATDGQLGDWGAGLTVYSCVLQDLDDAPVSLGDGSGGVLYQRSIDLVIWHQEP